MRHESGGTVEETMTTISKTVPLGRFGTPDETGRP
jgi:hypothetical protein